MKNNVRTVGIGLMCLGVLMTPVLGQALIFPHFANGNTDDLRTRWATEIDIANTGPASQVVRVSFFGADGTPRIVGLQGRGNPPGGILNCSSCTFEMKPRTMLDLQIDDGIASTLKATPGWVSVEGGEGTKATLIFRRLDNFMLSSKVIAEAGILPQFPTTNINFIPRIALVVDDGSATNPNKAEVGIALVNPDSTLAASGEIQLVQGTFGEVVGVASFNLPPRGQLAKFVSELFGPLDNTGRYYVRVHVASGLIAGVALRTIGTLISTIPAN